MLEGQPQLPPPIRHEENMAETSITVFSVCSSKDIDVWAVAAQYIQKNIKADRYFLIVPDHEITLFREKTPEAFGIIGDRSICGSLIEDLRIRISGKAEDRFGWYLQQFLKLSALYLHREDDLVVIWDADTVPLKPLSFRAESGQILHYGGQEHHKPYFATIERLLGLKRAVPYSFVAQSLAMKGSWLQAFFDEIEHRHKKPWPEAILDSINFSEGSGFSEYETLGTFAASNFGAEMLRIRSNWSRFGNRVIGSVHNLSDTEAREKLEIYDFVSFESWDSAPRLWSALVRRLKRLLI